MGLGGLTGCVLDAPLPDVGACAVYPDGVYEFGQIGIGSCIASPVALAVLDDGHTLAVDNANAFEDFTGGSALLLDLDKIDLTVGRNLVTDVVTGALDMPSFNGGMSYDASTDTLAITNKLSADSRTREETDSLYFVDVADPSAPAMNTSLGPDGGALGVGYDPNQVVADPLTGYLFVTNRTAHEVAMVDTTGAPAALVPPGGPARILPGAYDDADGSGSKASFALLESTDADSLDSHTWTARWAVGTVRAWVPDGRGAYRMESSGEGDWVHAPQDRDVDLTETDGASELIDPSVSVAAISVSGGVIDVTRMFFMSDGYVRDAQSRKLTSWTISDTAYLGPDESVGESVIGGPYNVIGDDEVYHLFYDGGDGVTQSIHVALSTSGDTYERTGAALLTPPVGSSYEDPFVLQDQQTGQWRMWFTVVAGDDWSIGEAVSDDLTTWTVLPDRFAGAHGAAAPAVSYYGGAYHLFYATKEMTRAEHEAVSADGTHWTELGAAFPTSYLTGPRSRVALLGIPENTFTWTDEAGIAYPYAVAPGTPFPNTDSGWLLQVAVGQWIDPLDGGELASGGIRLDSAVATDEAGSLDGWTTLTDADGVTRIGIVSYDAGTGLVSVGAEPVLEPGAAGTFDKDGVSSPVVVASGDGYVMYYAGLADGLTTIGRATSADGLTWTADPDPVLTNVETFEAISVIPGSATVSDGTVHLYYTGDDGNRLRIGEAEGPLTGGALTRLPGSEHPFVMDAGAPGDWDDSGVESPWVVVDGDTERMWYAGYSGEEWQLGYAERVSGGDWVRSSETDGTPRPILEPGGLTFGADGLVRPVVLPGVDGRSDGWTVWFTGLDAETSEIGRAVGTEPDRLWRDLRMPTLADSWTFTSVPENEGEAISLDLTVDGTVLTGQGCTDLVPDPLRGFVYVMCKSAPLVYVLDVRDDSDGTFQDLNYLGIEAVVKIKSSTQSSSGLRAGLLDPERPWLWGLASAPDGVDALDLTKIVDDADTEFVDEDIVAQLVAPNSRDYGVASVATLGPGQLALHPDGKHLFVTNFSRNSVWCYDLSTGAPATLVGQAEDLGENPYALTITPDGKYAIVANYSGEVIGDAVNSTLVVLDADPESPTFLQPLTWVVNK